MPLEEQTQNYTRSTSAPILQTAAMPQGPSSDLLFTGAAVAQWRLDFYFVRTSNTIKTSPSGRVQTRFTRRPRAGSMGSCARLPSGKLNHCLNADRVRGVSKSEVRREHDIDLHGCTLPICHCGSQSIINHGPGCYQMISSDICWLRLRKTSDFCPHRAHSHTLL